MRKDTIQIFVVSMIASLLIVPEVLGQARSSSATESGASSGAPSSISIRSNFLTIREGQLRRELRDIQRCLKDATLTQRDPQGRINRVPQTDLVNCGRRLRTVQRQLTQLGRQSGFLARQAEFLANRFQFLLEQQEFITRTQTDASR